jgi:uncharacterized protein with von Willebrand factor type A (vWA) domain
VYSEIADELNDIVDEERHAVDNATAGSRTQRRRTACAEPLATLPPTATSASTCCPTTSPARCASCRHTTSSRPKAAQRFEQLLDKIRQQLTQQMVEQMSGAMQGMTPEDMQHMKDMMAGLNEMIEKRERGEDPGSSSSWRVRRLLPENPQSLDELLEQMAQRMAAMQAMLNSMTPEQRAQLQQLSDQLLDDMDLRWQMDQLGQNLQGMFPNMNWGQSYDIEGTDPMGMGQAMQTMQELGEPRPAREPDAQRHEPGRAGRRPTWTGCAT